MASISQLMKILSADVVAALADDNGDQIADAGILESALAAAEEIVRAELTTAGYPTDVTMTALLDDLTTTFAVERLFERRREVLPGPWRERAARARILLREIAEERIFPPGIAKPRTRVEAAPCPEAVLHRPEILSDL